MCKNKGINKLCGDRIKQLRINSGLTQTELANILIINRSSLANYETGKHRIPCKILVLVAKFFKVRTDNLLGLEDYP